MRQERHALIALITLLFVSWAAPAAAQQPTQLIWGKKGTLLISYDDAKLAALNTSKRSQKVQNLPARDVLALSPTGELALIRVGGTAVELREVKRGEPVLRFEREAAPVAAHFTEDGMMLFVILDDGMIHVWKDTAKLVKSARALRGVKEDPDDLFVQMRKNKAEVSAGLADPVSGPVALGDGPDLALVQRGDSVTHWDTRTPTEATSIFRASGPIRTILIQQHIILTLTTEGKLEGRRAAGGSKRLSWSEEAPMEAIAAHPGYPGHFVAVSADAVALRALETGDIVWSVPRQPGAVCGVAIDPATKQLALCTDGTIALIALKDGAALKEFRREGDKVALLKRPKAPKASKKKR
jgi:hypothetical protein